MVCFGARNSEPMCDITTDVESARKRVSSAYSKIKNINAYVQSTTIVDKGIDTGGRGHKE